MADYSGVRPGTAPHLTSHLRALALIEALQRVEDSKAHLHVDHPKIVANVDLRYLALAIIELLIDRMGVGGTVSPSEMIEHLAGFARSTKPPFYFNDSWIQSQLSNKVL